MRHFSILGDLGSQRTLVSQSCAGRLKLRVVRRENVALHGYGQVSCNSVEYNVVEIVVGKYHGGQTVKFDALVVPDFQPLSMPGIADCPQALSKIIPKPPPPVQG